MNGNCPNHSGLDERSRRNAKDVQRLFDKFGEAISLMYKVDKKLDNWTGKVAGISICVTGTITVIIFVIRHFAGG